MSISKERACRSLRLDRRFCPTPFSTGPCCDDLHNIPDYRIGDRYLAWSWAACSLQQAIHIAPSERSYRKSRSAPEAARSAALDSRVRLPNVRFDGTNRSHERNRRAVLRCGRDGEDGRSGALFGARAGALDCRLGCARRHPRHRLPREVLYVVLSGFATSVRAPVAAPV